MISSYAITSVALIASFLFSIVRANVIHNNAAAITAAPHLEPRQLTGTLSYGDPRFMGWETYLGEVIQRTCATGMKLTSSGSWFDCCSTTLTSCYFATACDGPQTEVFPAGLSLSCSVSCVTGLFFTSTNDAAKYTYLGCGLSDFWVVSSTNTVGLSSWVPTAFQAAATTSKTPSSSSSSTTSTSTSSSPSSTPPNVVTITASATSTPSPTTSAAAATNNGPIIGGAVGGGLIGIGLIVLGILLYKRKQNSKVPPVQPQQPPGPEVQSTYYPTAGAMPSPSPGTYKPPMSPDTRWSSVPAYPGSPQTTYGQGQGQYGYVSVAQQEITPPMGNAIEVPGTQAQYMAELQGNTRG